jgi:hypothetical protein
MRLKNTKLTPHRFLFLSLFVIAFSGAYSYITSNTLHGKAVQPTPTPTSTSVIQVQPKPKIPTVTIDAAFILIASCEVSQVVFETPDPTDVDITLKDGTLRIVHSATADKFKSSISRAEAKCGHIDISSLPPRLI